MQRALNLSIQLPGDDSSLLPLHSDVWSGNAPYEVVFWLPLVDCYKTKSMYVLPRHKSDKVLADFTRYSSLSAEAFFRELEPELEWMEVPFGKALLFTHSVIHGNRVNEEATTRWSMNVRFKSLLSPYGSKEIGESFVPITVRPATRVGYAYREPKP
jgi:sporadic carbohydrate cluster 2OG-Fe(II) oxygenase